MIVTTLSNIYLLSVLLASEFCSTGVRRKQLMERRKTLEGMQGLFDVKMEFYAEH